MTVDVGVPASVVGGDVAGAPTPLSWTGRRRHQLIAAPWVAALGELEEIRRSRTANAGTYSYSYAELGDVLSHARGVLKAHDLAVFQVAEVVNGDVAVSTTVMHTSGAHLHVCPVPSAGREHRAERRVVMHLRPPLLADVDPRVGHR